MRKIVTSLLIGLCVGWLAARLLPGRVQPTEQLATPTPLEPGPLPESALPVAELSMAERAPAVSTAAESVERDVLITLALHRHAEEGLARGWKSVRQDELPADALEEGWKSYEKTVLEGAVGIGRALGERRTKAEAALADAQSGGVFALLEKLDAGGVGPLIDLVRDPRQFDPLFQRVANESARNALAAGEHPDELAEDGVTLTWPAGVFLVKDLMKDKDPYPRDVTLSGAGMDATMLVLGGGQLMTRGELRNLAIRDCTVHTNNNYLFDLRLKPASIRFERARFVGFDSGGGGSYLLSTKALAVSARQCRFEGGYGKWHDGTLMRINSGGVVARFEACSISRIHLGVNHWHPESTVYFLGCTLEQILEKHAAPGFEKPGIVFDGCSITNWEGPSQDLPKLDLNALFPNWKNEIE